MHNQPGCSRDAYISQAIRNKSLLIRALLEGFERFEGIRFKAEVDTVSQGKHISETASDKVKCPEPVEQKGRAVLNRAEVRGVYQCAIVVPEEGLI